MAGSEALLNSLFSQGASTAQSFGDAGKSSLDQVSQYFKNLLGKRSDVMGAIQPEASAVRSAADAQKKQQSEKGTARTGGAVAQNQQIEDEVRKAIESLIGQQRQNAAGALGNLGQGEINSMLSALGITTQGVQADVASKRAASAAMWSALIGGTADVASAGILK